VADRGVDQKGPGGDEDEIGGEAHALDQAFEMVAAEMIAKVPWKM
jgi:hypothetical protein